jgi:hypothetical protein
LVLAPFQRDLCSIPRLSRYKELSQLLTRVFGIPSLIILMRAARHGLSAAPERKKGGAEAPPSLGRKRPRKQQHDHGPPLLRQLI